MTIDLQKFYPSYAGGPTDIPDEVGALLFELERQESNERRRRYYHKAYYSLDYGDSIEKRALESPLTPENICEYAENLGELRAALQILTKTQAKRIYAHYILGKSKTAIAQAEGVSESSVFESIDRGLRRMKIFLQNSDFSPYKKPKISPDM